MRRALVHIISTFLVLVLACESIAENRVALVIGNGSYAEAPLSNPPNDATLMAQTLRALGFEVAVHINSDQRTIKRAIQDFGRRLETAGKDTVGLFYYAGHGVQANGVNYLIPIEASIEREADLVIEAVEARWVLAQMDFAGNQLNMVILDACRNNPYRATFRSATRGLVRMEAPKGSLIAYATAPNQVASDGVGANSPYTETLAAIMQRPGLPVLEMFNTVGVQVAARTNGQQQPWVSSSPLPGDFYFVPKQSAVPLAVQSPTPAFDERTLELAFWNSIKHSKDWLDYQAYLDQYGERGAFKALARVRRDRLQGVGVAAYPAHAEMKMPKVGTVGTWECSGPYGSERTSKVVRVENGIIREEGYTSGRGETFVEQTLLGIGTTLFKKLDYADGKGVRGQKYDEDDFRGYEKLESGSKFSGTVSEWHRKGSWDWRYTIEIGKPKTINHKVFGEIQVTPVIEKRNVVGGDYRSELEMLVYPELGLELRFTYKDGKGVYECDITAYE